MNSLSVEWIENKWWLYQTHIDITKYDENKDTLSNLMVLIIKLISFLTNIILV